MSAHLDHLGVEAGGAIRNGAIDNASGIAQLLLMGRAAANRALFVRWRGHAYHAPGDRFDQSDPPIDFASGVTMGRYVTAVAMELANAGERPRWVPGDVFGPERRR